MRVLNRLFFIAFLLFIHCAKDNGDSPESEKPVVFAVETNGSQLPYMMVETSKTIINEPKVAANLRVFLNKSLAYETPIGIEYRGSTSYRMSDKKSYGIETWDAGGLDAPYAFLNYPEEEDYIFMGHVFRASQNTIFDPSLMHHYIGHEMYRSMGRYASRTQWIDLEINGVYMGVYQFMEKLKRDKNRIDIEKLTPLDTEATAITGGYIIKIDKTAGGENGIGQPLEYFDNNWGDDALYTAANSWRSQYDIFKQPINFSPYRAPYHPDQYLETYFLYEYPKANEITNAQKEYIQGYINDFETALINDDFTTDTRTYTDYIDLDSFVDFFIINEITGNVDGYRLSTYMHKQRGEKLKMGPIWDLNIGYAKQGRVPVTDWIANYNVHVSQDVWMVPFWWPRLLEDPVFKQALKSRWTTLRAKTFSDASVMGRVEQTATYLKDNGAVDRNYNKWTGITVDYDGEVSILKNYLKNRLKWMDQTIGGF